MYRILYNDQTIFDPYGDGEIVTDAKMSTEVNAASYLDFTMSPLHPLYNTIKERDGIVRLYYDAEELFEGVIETIETDFNGYKSISCVSALDYLNDTLVRPYSTVSGEEPLTAPDEINRYFEWLIDQHNSHVLDAYKQFQIGVNQGANLSSSNSIYVKQDSSSTTANEITTNLLDAFGGYLMLRYVDGNLVLDLYADVHDMNTQIIDFGVNLLDFNKTVDTDDQYTALRPVGGTPEKKGSGEDPRPTTIESLPDGPTMYNTDVTKQGDVIYSVSGVTRYGYKETEWKTDDTTDPAKLLELAVPQLVKRSSPLLNIDIKAVDLALYMDGYEHLRVGQAVRIRSKPHGVDEYMMVSSIDLDLQDPGQSDYQLGVSYDTLTGQQSAYLRTLNNGINGSLDAVASLDQITKDHAIQIGHVTEIAEEAQDTANNAQNAADNAKNTANANKTELQNMKDSVSKVQSNVDAVEQKAADLASELDGTKATVEQVTTDLGEVKTTVSNAVTKADQALQVSTSASQTATEAKTTATSAYQDAQSALTQSSTATQTANAVKTELETNYSTTDEIAEQYATKSLVEQTSQSITSTVSQTYVSKKDAEQTYATKTEVKQTSDSLTVTISSAVSKADSAAEAAADAQNTANNAQSTANTANTNAASAQLDATNANNRVGNLETCIKMTTQGVRVGKISNGDFTGYSALVNSNGSFNILDSNSKQVVSFGPNSTLFCDSTGNAKLAMLYDPSSSLYQVGTVTSNFATTIKSGLTVDGQWLKLASTERNIEISAANGRILLKPSGDRDNPENGISFYSGVRFEKDGTSLRHIYRGSLVANPNGANGLSITHARQHMNGDVCVAINGDWQANRLVVMGCDYDSGLYNVRLYNLGSGSLNSTVRIDWCVFETEEFTPQ